MRIATEHAKFWQPEVKLGLPPGGGGTQRLPRLVGKGRALQLILTGEIISASRAHELGLIHRVYSDDQFAQEVAAYVALLASKSASAVMLSKRLLYNMDSMSFESALQSGVEINAIARMTEDCRKGIERFVKKT